MNSLSERAISHFWRRSHRRCAQGFEFGFLDAEDAGALQPKLEGALTLLNDYDPDAFAEMQRAMPRIFVTATPTHLACFWRDLGLCELRADYIGSPETSVLALAMTLVHEGMHARITARGLHRRGLALAREERLAIRAEISLAQRLSGAEPLVEAARRRLARPESVYSRERYQQRALLAARQLGCPKWLVCAVARWRGVELNPQGWVDPYATERQRRRVGRLRRIGPSTSVHYLCYGFWLVAVLLCGSFVPAFSGTYAGMTTIAGWAFIGAYTRRRRREALERQFESAAG